MADVIVIGAGIGGLAAAIDCAARGLDVLVLERAGRPGGKLSTAAPAGRAVDAGPTVLTMLDVFRDLLADAGRNLDDYMTVHRADLLARHFWPDGSRLDLFADTRRSADAIRAFAGEDEERGFRAFTAASAAIFDALHHTFITAPKPANPLALMARGGVAGLAGFARIDPYRSLHRMVAEHFRDPRLVQLFARYSTYAGSSPFETPATLALITDVERRGVWQVTGGMAGFVDGIAAAARDCGVRIVCGVDVDRIETRQGAVSGVLAGGRRFAAPRIVFNGDAGALAAGLVDAAHRRAVPRPDPRRRAFSALTIALDAPLAGVELAHHNVFFASDGAAEFHALAAGRMPRDPTVYLCAQDRGPGASGGGHGQAERALLVLNAPPDGDIHDYGEEEIDRCTTDAFHTLSRAGLILPPSPPLSISTPSDFAHRFPATGGALYGQASHGWMASFRRPAARTRIAGLYCAGGSIHPGAGLPMAALSGRIAARTLARDLGRDHASTSRSRKGAMPGGMSMPSARTNATG